MCRPDEPTGDKSEEERGCCFTSKMPNKDAEHLNTFLQRESKRVARHPCAYLCSCVFLTLALSAIGLIVGEFAIEVENEGWWSRGTVQSDRQRQFVVINNQRFNLAYNESAWDIWMDQEINHPSYEKLIYSPPTIPDIMKEAMEGSEEETEDDGDEGEDEIFRALSANDKFISQKVQEDEERRRLDQEAPASVLEGCDLGFYSDLSGGNLWPMWKIPDKEYESTETRSVLDADVLEAICIAESNR